jgi:cytochrome c
LNKWLTSPKTYAPGTKMGYAGIPSDENRADVIAYLRSLSPTPEPLPTQAEADAEAAAAKKAAAGASAPAGGEAAAAPDEPLPVLLAKATPEAGQAYTKKICVACHSFKEGGPNKVGPNLYGVVGRKQASAEGYTYSSALQAHTGVWTFDELNKWLTSPKAYAPGTKMSYAGIPSAQSRADVIDYLHTLSANPLPLPGAAAAPAPAKPEATAPASPQATPPAPTNGTPAPK